MLPDVIRIEPASACNLRCLHCPTGIVQMARGIMKWDVFERVLESLRCKTVVLYHGGEPFLNKRFLSMVREVKSLGIGYIKTVSNGMLIRDYDAVVTSGLDLIEISIDGTSGEANDRLRRKAYFPRIRDAIHGLQVAKSRLKSDIEICVSTTQFSDEFPQWLLEEFEGVSFKLTRAMKWPGVDFDFEYIQEAPPETPTCSLMDDTLTVRWNGDVVPCCFDLTSQIVLGNVMDDSLENIWAGEQYARFREDFKQGNYHPLCADCAFVRGPRYLK